MAVAVLDEILARYDVMPPGGKVGYQREVLDLTRHLRWVPNPGPQTEAYHSEADVLLYGGEPGGGKTQLLLGLAFNEHERSLICRRQYTDLDYIIDCAIKIHGTRDGYSGQPPPTLRHAKGLIDFGAAARVGDEQRQMGKPHDFQGFDEATQFAHKQIKFIGAWNRTDKPGQRCRIVMATNPPLSPEGLWVVAMFAPWLDPKFPKPAKPGELRWVIIDNDDDEHWVDGPGEYRLENGETRFAQSRTFIPATLADNPAYDPAEYKKNLDALPAEIREILMGGFKTAFRDRQFQVIPTAWVMAAFARWKPRPPEGIPMTAIGVDPTGGGDDELAIAPRHDWWFAPYITVPGSEFDKEALGREQAAKVLTNRKDRAKIGCDMGGGYGQALLEALGDNLERGEFIPHVGASRSSGRTRDNKLGFASKRAEVYWKFREALDPEQEFGSPIELPEDLELLADLTVLDFKLTPNGYEVTPKHSPGKDADCVLRRLGRSPNKGDAVVISWSVGDRMVPRGRSYSTPRSGGQVPKTNLGPRRRGR